MAPLSQSHVADLLESCSQMATERSAIAAILADLPDSFGAVREALNQLQRIVSDNVADHVGP